MAKTQEELNELKQELATELKELTDEELIIVSGGLKPVEIEIDLGTTYSNMP